MMHWFHRVKDIVTEVKADFDIVIMDGTLRWVCCRQHYLRVGYVVVPVPTEITDFASTRPSAICIGIRQTRCMRNLCDEVAAGHAVSADPLFSASEKTATLGSEFVLDQIRKTFKYGLHAVGDQKARRWSAISVLDAPYGV